MEFGNPIVGLEELIRSAIKSQDYVAGTTGWRISQTGAAEFNNIVIHGTSGQIVVIGQSGSAQLILGIFGGAPTVTFRSGSANEQEEAYLISDIGNQGAVNEYITFQVLGPRANSPYDRRVMMQMNSRNADGSSQPNWQVRDSTSGSMLRIANDIGVICDVPFSAPNFPSGGWTSFTPTWTTSTGNNTPSFGNATVNCDYTRAGRMITARYEIVFGTTTNFGAAPGTGDNWRFTLPVQASSTTTVSGFGELSQTNGIRCMSRWRFTTSNTLEMEISSGRVDGTAITNTGLTDSLSPWTWSSADSVRGIVTYEAVS